MLNVFRPGFTEHHARFGQADDQTKNTVKTEYVTTQNKILGMARMRQVRVRDDSCTLHSAFEHYRKTCYGPYSSANEDDQPFGAGANK